jgi:acid phosphatase
MRLFYISLLITLAVSSLPAYATPNNMQWTTQQLENYYQSGEYNTDVQTVIQLAEVQLNRAIDNNLGKKLAIILDIDETALSNYDQIAAHLNSIKDVGDIPSKQYLQTISHPSNDPAIQATLGLYQNAIKHHVTVFFITGRHDNERDYTEKNLRNAGYTQWKQLIMRQPKEYDVSAEIYKTRARKQIVAQGYDIIENIGDQYSDLKGGYADTTFKLPNPFYYIA